MMKLKALEDLAQRSAGTIDISLDRTRKPKIFLVDRDRPCLVAGYLESVHRELREGGVFRISLLPYITLDTHVGFLSERNGDRLDILLNPVVANQFHITTTYREHQRAAQRFVDGLLAHQSLTHRKSGYRLQFQDYLKGARQI